MRKGLGIYLENREKPATTCTCLLSLQVLEVIASNKAVAIKVAKDRQVHICTLSVSLIVVATCI